MINKLQLVKGITAFVVGSGTTTIVTSLIKNNVPMNNPLSKVSVLAGGIVLGAMAADHSKKYVDRKIDEIVKYWNDRMAEAEAAA